MTKTLKGNEIMRDLERRIRSLEQDVADLKRGNVYGPPPTTAHLACNCLTFKRGESSGGWYCPKHGQQL